jgi:hypothetical protein
MKKHRLTKWRKVDLHTYLLNELQTDGVNVGDYDMFYEFD